MIGEKRRVEPFSEPFKYLKEDPLYALYNPETVARDNIASTTHSIFQSLLNLSFINDYENLYEQSLAAVKEWKAKSVPSQCIQTSTMAKIILQTERFCNRSREVIKIQFADQSEIMITSQQISFLALFSDTIAALWNDNWKEKRTQEITIKDPTIDKEIVACIIQLLLNHEHIIPEQSSIFKLLLAINFLQIPHLKCELLDRLKKYVEEHYKEIESILLILDFLLGHMPDQKELIDDCFDRIHHFVLTREEHELPESFSFQAPILKTIEPALRLMLSGKYQVALRLFKEQPEPFDPLVILFHNITCLSGEFCDKYTADEESTDYRYLIIAGQLLTKKTPEKAHENFQTVVKLKPHHFFVRGLDGYALKNINTQTAIEKLKEQIQATPSSISWQIKLAKVYRINKQLDDSHHIYNKILTLYPENTYALRKKIMNIHLSNPEVINLAQKSLLLKNPSRPRDFPRIYESLILSLIDLKHYADAMEYAQKSIKAHPDCNFLKQLSVDLSLCLKDLDKARETIALFPKVSKDFHFYSAWLAIVEQKFSLAEERIAELEKLPYFMYLEPEALKCYLYALRKDEAQFTTLFPKIPSKWLITDYVYILYLLTSNKNEEVIAEVIKKKDRIWLLELKACAYYNLEKKDFARDVVKEIQKLWPSYPLPKKLKDLLLPKESSYVYPALE